MSNLKHQSSLVLKIQTIQILNSYFKSQFINPQRIPSHNSSIQIIDKVKYNEKKG
jgi:hypothetical protein